MFHQFLNFFRLLLQLDETEKGFDSVWSQHEKRLSQCLELRKFEQEFKEVINFLFLFNLTVQTNEPYLMNFKFYIVTKNNILLFQKMNFAFLQL